MAKKGTIGYQAELLRRKGQRRIERLQEFLRSNDISESTRKWANNTIREIKSAMQGTRQYSKTGKRYKSKTLSYIKKQMFRLEVAIKEVAPRFTLSGDSFEVTQRELNRASVKLPSIYTKSEVQTFYHATQKIWQRKGVGEHDRNVAILEYFNSRRKKNELSPMRLDQIVDYVLGANKQIQSRTAKIESYGEYDMEAEEFYSQGVIDGGDGDYDSNSAATTEAIQGIRDAMQKLFILPDPLKAFNED